MSSILIQTFTQVKESKNIRKDPHNSGSEPHAVDTAIASARNAEARTERNLDYSAAEERDKLTVRSIAAETEVRPAAS
jgi:hypothetical protein